MVGLSHLRRSFPTLTALRIIKWDFQNSWGLLAPAWLCWGCLQLVEHWVLHAGKQRDGKSRRQISALPGWGS